MENYTQTAPEQLKPMLIAFTELEKLQNKYQLELAANTLIDFIQSLQIIALKPAIADMKQNIKKINKSTEEILVLIAQ